LAHIALAADTVDFTHNALAAEIGRSLNNFANKFMPEHAGESHVPFDDLQVRRTNARFAHADKTFTRRRRRIGLIGREACTAVGRCARGLNEYRAHAQSLIDRCGSGR